MFIFFVALSWSTAPMSAFSKDFESLIVSVMSGIFWLSGIMYDSYNFDEPLKTVMLFNPINFFVNGYRNCFLYNRGFWEYKTELAIFLIELSWCLHSVYSTTTGSGKSFLTYFNGRVILWQNRLYLLKM